MKTRLGFFGLIIAAVCCGLTFTSHAATGATAKPKAPEGWQTAAPRDEIEPSFAYNPRGGRDEKGTLIITTDNREGLDGFWTKTYAVKGGEYYRFQVWRKVKNVPYARMSTPVRILWEDDKGKRVLRDEPVVTSVLRDLAPNAEPDYPTDEETDAEGWPEVAGVYRAPPKAT